MLNLKLAKSKIENEEGMNHLLVKVKPEESDIKIERPIAFMLVIDVSGSMNSYMSNGSFQNVNVHRTQILKDDQLLNHYHESRENERSTKLDYVKQASERLVDMMKDGDKLGVVSFSDSAALEYPLTDLTKDDRFKLKDRIRALSVRGMTNVSDGLELAYRQIPNSLKESHHVKLLLLSDGQANYGIKGVDGIASLVSDYQNNDVSVSTIGVGSDYNSFYMESIATASGGMFYHLEGMEQLNGIFTKELENLTTLTTKQAKVRIILPEGIHLEENLNGYKEDAERAIFLGNVFSEQKILNEIYTEEEIPKGNRTIKVILEYLNHEGQKKVIEESIKIDLVGGDEIGEIETDEEVVELVKSMMEAKVKKEALRNYEIGNFSDATNGIQSSLTSMKSVSANYSMDMSDAFEELSSMEKNMTMRKIDKATTKSLYSMSYKKTRNEKE